MYHINTNYQNSFIWVAGGQELKFKIGMTKTMGWQEFKSRVWQLLVTAPPPSQLPVD